VSEFTKCAHSNIHWGENILKYVHSNIHLGREYSEICTFKYSIGERIFWNMYIQIFTWGENLLKYVHLNIHLGRIYSNMYIQIFTWERIYSNIHCENFLKSLRSKLFWWMSLHVQTITADQIPLITNWQIQDYTFKYLLGREFPKYLQYIQIY
jgi:hypothetical protein